MDLTTIANLIILGLNIKLYTEFFKSVSITKRDESKPQTGKAEG